MDAQGYFARLNYTLANEDPAMESAIALQGLGSVASVTGSGSRVLAFLEKGAKRVTCIDLVQEQLWLAELRFETFRKLSRSDALALWGLPPEPEDPKRRRALFEKISLSKPCREFFLGLFGETQWGSLTYLGKWERTFQKLSRIVRTVVGDAAEQLFECKTLEEQKAFIRDHYPRWRWNIVLRLIGNSAFFNALLYKGAFPRKNIEENHFQFYSNAFDRLFALCPARESYFMHLSFFGKIREEAGLPFEWNPSTYARIQSALQSAEIHFVRGDLIQTLASKTQEWDLVSLSDVPSYFAGELENNYLQAFKDSLRPGARVILRSYLHVPEGTRLDGFKEVTSDFTDAIRAERVQMYRVQVFERSSP